MVYWAQHINEEDDTESSRVTDRTIVTTGFNVDNRSRFELNDWSKLTLVYGAEYYVDSQTGEDSVPIDGSTPAVPDADATYYGTFVQAEFDLQNPAGLPGEFKIIPGVRWDGFENNYKDNQDYEDFEKQAVSPKIALSYKPVPWFMVFGNVGNAFRAPSYAELYAQGAHFSLGSGYTNEFRSNPDLEPQEATTYEAGLGFDFKGVLSAGDSLKIKGSRWRTKAKNFIDLDVVYGGCTPAPGYFDQDSCYSQYENIDKAKLDGTEIEAKYDAARWFASFSYTNIDGRNETTGAYLGSLQPDKIVLNAGLKFPEYWSRVGSRFTFADDFTKASASEQRDGYNLIDIYASFEPEDGPFKGFRLDLGVDNLADEAYEAVAAGAYEEGINYKASLSWTHKW